MCHTPFEVDMQINGRYLCSLALMALVTLMLGACAADPVGDLEEGTTDVGTGDDAAEDDAEVTEDGADDEAGAEDADDAAADGASITVAGDQADELDPTTARTAAASVILDTICYALYAYDTDAELQPRLATELPDTSDDGLTVTIGIRDDVTFNDGTPLDAEAVKISLDRHRELPDSARAGEMAIITDVEVVDEHTVELALEEPFAALGATLAGPPGRIMSPAQLEELGDDFGGDPVCAGPFKFAERPDQDRVIVERAEEFYDADEVQLDQIIFVAIDDNAVAVSNLRSGEVDVVSALAPVNLDDAEGDGNIEVFRRPGTGYVGFTINLGLVDGMDEPVGQVDTPIAQDPRLREAFELSLDRELINEIVYDGLHDVGCTAVSPNVPFAAANPECPERDVERAMELIEESDYDAPIEVDLMVSTDPDRMRIAELTQSMAAEAGFEVNVRSLEATTTIDEATAGDYEMWLIGFGGGPDPDTALYRMNHSQGGSNDSGVGFTDIDDEIDAALDATRTEPDQDARIELFREPLELIAERRAIIYLYHPSQIVGARDHLTGIELRPNGVDFAQVGVAD